MICSMKDNRYLNWIVNGVTIEFSDKGIVNENQRKKYDIVNGSHLLVKSVGPDDVGLYNCHSSANTFADYRAFLLLLHSEPTCTHLTNATGNDFVSCSIIYSGKANVGIELTDSLGKTLHAESRMSQPGVTNASFVASIKRGVDSVELKIRFVHECENQAEHDTCARNVPEKTWKFNLPNAFETSTKSSMMPEIRCSCDGYDHLKTIGYCALTLILGIVVTIVVHNGSWNATWKKLRTNQPPLSSAVSEQSSELKEILNIRVRDPACTGKDLGLNLINTEQDESLLNENRELEKSWRSKRKRT